MQALYTAAIYFGTFLVIGGIGNRALTRWMDRHGTTLPEAKDQFGHSGCKEHRFLLGFWYKDEPDGLTAPRPRGWSCRAPRP